MGRVITIFRVVLFIYIMWESLSDSRSISTFVSSRACNELIMDSPLPAHTNVESCKVYRGVVIL